MATSLRARLLLSYGLLVAVLTCLYSVGALVGILRNPLVYASTAQQLRDAQRAANAPSAQLSALATGTDSASLGQLAARLNTRLVVVQEDGSLLADSQAGAAPALRTPAVRLKLFAQRNEVAFLRDDSNRLWLVLVQTLDSQSYLILAVQRPRLALIEMFSNELVRPALLAGMIGLVAAMLVAFGMAQWISTPLQRIGQAADAVAAGHYRPIPLEGPQEVRRLAHSFNHMARRVQDSLQSQRELVANVSHELKTPLTSIQGFTQAILDGVAQTPEEIQQAAAVIQSEANRMGRLAQDLVTLARMENGAGSLQRAPLDLSVLLRSVVERFQPQAAQAGVQLELALGDLPALVADGDRLVQVFANLLDNAIKYSPAGGRVTVEARRQASAAVEIRVADTGKGIPPAERERIFQRFYRADATRPGAGLGLTIARQIVVAHGGSIQVENNPPHGSLFSVILPIRPG